MPLFPRYDGTVVRAGALRRFMPFLMRGRNESAVYFAQRIDVGPTLAWLESPDGAGYTFLHVVLAAILRTLVLRPGMNRFVVGRTLYQRKGLSMAFAVKKRLDDDGKLTTVKIDFEPTDGIADVKRRIDEAISEGRGEADTTSEKEMNVVARLPGPLIGLLMWLQGLLDGWNLLPSGMIKPDPLYSSVFLANLGSIGLDAPFHHLYEYGTTPLFAVIGRIHKEQWVDDAGATDIRDTVLIRWTFDERICDGLYCARSLDQMKGFLAAPGG